MKQDRPKGECGWGYVRCSSDKQDHASQIGSIKSWAERTGLTISRWFVDTGSRHKAEKREEFCRMMDLLASEPPDFLVVDAQIRFGGKPGGYEYGSYVHKLRCNNVELWSVTEGLLSGTDPLTVVQAAIGSLTTTKEQEERAERTIRGKVFGGAKKGEWQGGYPPYGFDVVCYGKDGEEKWRCVWEGYFERVKVLPDGTRNRYDGKGNMPAHDEFDTLKLAPSIVEARVKNAQSIFEGFATEAISLRAMAHRLNKLGIDSVFGKGWYAAKIKEMLSNPAYIGKPAWNKKGHGDFLEWKEGKYQKVPWEGERAVVGKRRIKDKADHVQPDKAVITPIIKQEIWDKVQEKLAGRTSPIKRAPRNEGLWLSGLLYCGKCNKPLHAWGQHNSYVCGTYRHYGPANPTGCTMHRVKQPLLEGIIDRYLVETKQKIAFLKRAQTKQETVEPLEQERKSKSKEANKTKAAMYETVKGEIPYLDDFFQGETDWPEGLSLEHTYGYFFSKRKAQLEKELTEKDAELSRLVLAYADLSGRAKAKAKQRTDALENEINELQGRLDNLEAKLAGLNKELAAMDKAIEQAKKVLQSQSPRKKAEALRDIVSKIFCHFIPLDKPHRGQRDRLERVEILPLLGDPISYPASPIVVTGSRGPD
jgi:hypothetical protein